MIAHLVGGPAHGEEVTVTDNPHRIIEIPKLEPLPILPYYNSDFEPVAGPLETHAYRLLHTDGRYAIYRWEPPRVTAHFRLTLQGPDHDGELYRRLRNLTDEGEAVQVTSMMYDGRTVDVEGIAVVDGPPDAKAAEDASKLVRGVVERKLRGHTLTAFAVDVRDG